MFEKLGFRKKDNNQYINFSDDKINVLLLGNSGCGKSTLINALLGREEAETGAGFAVTKNIEVYEDDELPFRMIDTIGFEHGLFKQYKIKHDLAKFSEDSVKNREAKKFVHVIWYCIDGTARRIDMESLDYIKSVVGSWSRVPVIFVITKSYSEIERDENKRIAQEAINKYNSKHKRSPLNVKDIICVVAKEYEISKDVVVAPMGLDTLLNKTNELAPIAKRVADNSIREIDLKLKRKQASTAVNTSVIASVAVGAVPIPVPDSTVLIPVQTKMIRDISKAYDQENEGISDDIKKYILQLGATTIAGRALVKTIKNVPGLNIAASLIDAAVAGAITFVSGKTAQIIFEHFYTGEWDKEGFNVDSEVQQIFKDLMPGIIDKLSDFLKGSKNSITLADIRDKKLDSKISAARKKEEKNNKKHPVTEFNSIAMDDGDPFFGKKSKVRELQEKQQELLEQLRENEAALARKDEQIAFMQSLLQKIGIPLDLLTKSFEEIQMLREELGEKLLSSDESVREAALKQLQDKAAEIIEQLTAKTITAENKAFYEVKLKNALSDDVWNRLDPRSKSFLITAKSNFDSMSRMQDSDSFDYSGVCLLMTKALEVETANRFYFLYKRYLSRKYREIYRWPFAIRRWEGGEATNTVIDENDFTLGSVVPFAGLKRVYDEAGIQIGLEWGNRYNKREFLEFAAERLFRTTDMDFVENEIMNDSTFIETVRLDYRNPSAHREELNIVSARKCFNYMVDIQHMLKKMLEPMAV